ncbi:hypothetical protein KR018_011108, partial [Drosophila ironensis]
ASKIIMRKITSIKSFAGADRERIKTAAVNKVRFAEIRRKGLVESVRVASDERNFHWVQEFAYFLREAELSDGEVEEILRNAKTIVHMLSPDFYNLVETLLSINWRTRNYMVIEAYTAFCIDILVAHNAYIPMGICKCILHWIPADLDAADWVNGQPSEKARSDLKPIHDILNRIVTAVPMAFDVVVETISAKFPYFKKPAYVTGGYLYNVLWLLDYKPVFEELILQLVLQKLLVLDVNAPREEIIDECDTEGNSEEPVSHPIGQTLDTCLYIFFDFLDTKCRIKPGWSEEKRRAANRIFMMLLYTFDEVLMPSHNTHHVQFVIFVVASIRTSYSDAFLSTLWQKAQNINVSSIIRHAAIGYIASFLARAKFVQLRTIKMYICELSKWAHSYINDSDEYGQNCSLKANLVFFSVCQAIFYLIAFRARDLTASAEDLLFLQTLQLSRLAMCHFNPLRYCLAPVATAFAGVTRTYQLAYCHTVLERNARRKLATIYSHDKSMPEETLETFFPFDPYLLKLSNYYVRNHYLVYQGNSEDSMDVSASNVLHRQRCDSEMVEDDDFILADKRQKLLDLSQTQEPDNHF